MKKGNLFLDFIKTINTSEFKLITYYKNFIKFTSPKIIITTTDNDIQFYELKKIFKIYNLYLYKMVSVSNIGSRVKFLKNIETLHVTICLFIINI